MTECSVEMDGRVDSVNNFVSNHRHNRLERIIDDVFGSVFSSSGIQSIHIRDFRSTRAKLFCLASKGTSSLQVVSDFDQTISKYKHEGILSPTCHEIFEMDPELTSEVKETLVALRRKYRPIYMDPHLSDAEKAPLMLDWCHSTHDLLEKCGLHRDTLVKTVNDCRLVLRDDVPEFTDILNQHNIPLLIFSAGLGDVIELVLKNLNTLTQNVRIISNFMVFNEKGLLTGFSKPSIHVFNKTAAVIANGDYAAISRERPCILLLGDSTGDVHMADGAIADDPMNTSGTVLRIGFLNESIEANLEKFKNIYDIVLVNDDSFNIPLTILRNIMRCHQLWTDEDSFDDPASTVIDSTGF